MQMSLQCCALYNDFHLQLFHFLLHFTPSTPYRKILIFKMQITFIYTAHARYAFAVAVTAVKLDSAAAAIENDSGMTWSRCAIDRSQLPPPVVELDGIERRGQLLLSWRLPCAEHELQVDAFKFYVARCWDETGVSVTNASNVVCLNRSETATVRLDEPEAHATVIELGKHFSTLADRHHYHYVVQMSSVGTERESRLTDAIRVLDDNRTARQLSSRLVRTLVIVAIALAVGAGLVCLAVIVRVAAKRLLADWRDVQAECRNIRLPPPPPASHSRSASPPRNAKRSLEMSLMRPLDNNVFEEEDGAASSSAYVSAPPETDASSLAASAQKTLGADSLYVDSAHGSAGTSSTYLVADRRPNSEYTMSTSEGYRQRFS